MAVPIEAWPVPSVVQAPLNYEVPGHEKPVLYTAMPGAAVPARMATVESHTVAIADGRPIEDR